MTTEIEKQESRVDPWTDLDRAFDEMRAGFFDAFGLPSPFPLVGSPGEAPRPGLRAPRADVTDTGPSYRIRADVPGIPKEQLDIRVKGSTVEIRGEQARETEERKEQYVHRERTYSGYYRAIELPEPVVAKDVKAKLENGVLVLDLPKETPTPAPTEVKLTVE